MRHAQRGSEEQRLSLDELAATLAPYFDAEGGGHMIDQPWQPRLRSPIAWDSVTFVSAEHLALTHEPVTINNILYLLLEQPRPGAGLGP